MFAPTKSAGSSGGGTSSNGSTSNGSSKSNSNGAAPAAAAASASNASSSSSSSSSAAASPPTTLTLSGTTVHFPFTPYAVQETYMSTVLTSLARSENALLESPTGTGKTLCLLCSTLAWQRGMAARAASSGALGSQLSQPVSSGAGMVGQQSGDGSGGGGGAIMSSMSSSAMAAAGSQQQQQQQQTAARAPVILYATRTHSQLSQVVRELRSTRYRPRYAVLGSREQLCVHPKVNPKDAGACGGISGGRKSAASSSRRVVVVARTGADINAGCNRLNKERKCRFRNNLDGFVMPEIESAGSAPSNSRGGGNGNGGYSPHQPIYDMEELLQLGVHRSICPFYLTRSHLPSAEIIFLPYNYLLDPDIRSNTLAEINWSNAVIVFDEAHNLESFASDSASFDLTGVDVAGCVAEVQRAIGYLQSGSSEVMAANSGEGPVSLDNVIRLKALLLRFEQYIDKDLPAGGGSYTGEYIFHLMKEGLNVMHSNHVQLINMIRRVSDFILDVRGGGMAAAGAVGGKTSGATPKLDYLISALKKVFGGAGSTQMQCVARAGGYRVNITPKSGGGGGGGAARTLSYWCLTPSLALIDLKALNVRSILVTSGTLSPLPSYALELGLSFPNRLENPHIISSRQVHVQIISKGVSGKQLCSNYGRRDDPEYITELGNTLASLARVVPDGMLVFFPSYGVMNGCVAGWGGPRRGGAGGGRGGGGGGRGGDRSGGSGGRGFFAPRRRSGGTAAANSAANSDRFSFPHCPDYYGSMTNGSTNKAPWSRLLATKAVVLEPRSTSNLPAAIAEFKKSLSRPKSTGAILMGVCRGKISEGIDFADNMCRAVVITGLPFPPYKDDKVRLKREYLDSVKASRAIRNENAGFDASPEEPGVVGKGNDHAKQQQIQQPESLSGAAWYDQQAHRAVNQAVGRTIRHRNDYGAILLLDSRFADIRNRKGLSKWVRPYIKDDGGMGKNIGELGRFFKGAREMKERERAKAAGSAGRVQLQYEVEGEVEEDVQQDEVTRITVVRTEKRGDRADGNKDGSNDALLRGYVHPDLVLTRMDLKDQNIDAPDNGIENDIFDDLPKHSEAPKIDESGLESLYAGSDKARRKTTAKIAPSGYSHGEQQDTGSAFSSLPSERLASTRNPYQASKDSSIARVAGVKRKHQGTSKGVKRPPSSHSESSSWRPTSAGSKSGNGARQFFDAARGSLSVDDFNSVRSTLLRMKQHGDDEDKKSYLETAEDLIMVLNRYDDGLLDMFYPLLPSTMAPSVMKVASTTIFNASRFKRVAKKTLSTEEFDMISVSVVALITTCQAGGEEMRQYIRDVEPILKVLTKHPSSSLFSSFVSIVPARHRQAVQALSQQIKRKEEMKRMKDAERSMLGEASIKMENFRRPATAGNSSSSTNRSSPAKVKMEEATNPEHLEAQREMEGALIAAQQARDAARDRLHKKLKVETAGRSPALPMTSSKPTAAAGDKPVPKFAIRNPYASRPSSSANSSIGTKGATKVERPGVVRSGIGPVKLSTDSKAHVTGAAAANSSTYIDSTHRVSKRARSMLQHGKTVNGQKNKVDESKELDALDQCLQQVKTDVYSKTSTRQPLGKFKQNVPEGLDCRLCEEPMNDPLVSDCNHSACTACWSKWLQKKSTCPVCRAPTTRDGLSRMVFRDGGGGCDGFGSSGERGEDVPTLSEVVRDAEASSSSGGEGEDDDDDDDELELVSG